MTNFVCVCIYICMYVCICIYIYNMANFVYIYKKHVYIDYIRAYRHKRKKCKERHMHKVCVGKTKFAWKKQSWCMRKSRFSVSNIYIYVYMYVYT